jgi:hypothetical protein
MNNKIKNTATVLAVALVGFAAFVVRAERPPRRATVEGAKLHKFSKTVEKERPQLDEETRGAKGSELIDTALLIQ